MKSYTHNLIRILSSLDREIHTGAEVGVWQGQTSRKLLQRFPELRLFLVDNYEPENLKPTRLLLRTTAEKAEARAHELLDPFGDRAVWLRMASLEAAKQVSPHSLDFAFLDADHRYEAISKDIRIWVHKVRSGGICAGHDYGGKWEGVKRAVDEQFGNSVNIPKGSSRIWWVNV